MDEACGIDCIKYRNNLNFMKFQMLIIFESLVFVVSNKSFEIVKTWKLLQNFHKESTNYNLHSYSKLFKVSAQNQTMMFNKTS